MVVATTWLQRFSDALTQLCGSAPPVHLCECYALSNEGDGVDDLESWVSIQKKTLGWSQAKSIIFAALHLADTPNPDVGHLSKDGSVNLEKVLEREKKKSLAKLDDDAAKKAYQTMMLLAQDRSSDLYTSAGGQRAVCNMHKAFWNGFNGKSDQGLSAMKSPSNAMLMASREAGIEYALVLRKSLGKKKQAKNAKEIVGC
jgi:hypothetical protein